VKYLIETLSIFSFIPLFRHQLCRQPTSHCKNL